MCDVRHFRPGVYRPPVTVPSCSLFSDQSGGDTQVPWNAHVEGAKAAVSQSLEPTWNLLCVELLCLGTFVSALWLI